MKRKCSQAFLDLAAVTALHGEEIQHAVSEVVSSGRYLHGHMTEGLSRILRVILEQNSVLGVQVDWIHCI